MKSKDDNLTPTEQEQFAQCRVAIKNGPFTPEAIGEPLWLVDTRRLYRQSYGDTKSLYCAVTSREPEECAAIIEEWKQTPRGREVMNGNPSNDSGNSSDAAEPAGKAPLPPSAKYPMAQVAETRKNTARHHVDDLRAAAAEASATKRPAQPQESGQASAVAVSTPKPEAPAGKPALKTPGDHQSAKNKTAKDYVPKAKPASAPLTAAAGEVKRSGPKPEAYKSSSPSGPAQGCHTPLPQPVEMELSALTLDAGLQCRASINKATIAKYAERMRAGDVFPALDAFEIDGACLLADGWQRYGGAQKAGLTKFPVILHQGTRQDAIRFAIQANNAHPLPLNNKDKRRAVEMMVHECADDSDRAIAILVKVSHTFVANVRRQLATVASSDERTGRDGIWHLLEDNGRV